MKPPPRQPETSVSAEVGSELFRSGCSTEVCRSVPPQEHFFSLRYCVRPRRRGAGGRPTLPRCPASPGEPPGRRTYGIGEDDGEFGYTDEYHGNTFDFPGHLDHDVHRWLDDPTYDPKSLEDFDDNTPFDEFGRDLE